MGQLGLGWHTNKNSKKLKNSSANSTKALLIQKRLRRSGIVYLQ